MSRLIKKERLRYDLDNEHLVRRYWKHATLYELHRRSCIWLSEIVLWKNELSFIKGLFYDSFENPSAIKQIKVTDEVMGKINHLQNDLEGIKRNIEEHEMELNAVVHLHHKKLRKNYRHDHDLLEEALNSYMTKYKEMKISLFSLTSQSPTLLRISK